MTKTKMIGVVLSLAIGHNLAFAGATTSGRYQDVKNADTLDQPTARERVKWAFKCYPYLRGSMPDKVAILIDAQSGNHLEGYPVFGEVDENGKVTKVWQAPVTEDAPCTDAQKYGFLGFCAAGCYTPDQMIFFSDGPHAIRQAQQSSRQDIVTLSPEASLDNLDYQVSQLKSYTVDIKEYEQHILRITTLTGGELKVTLNHPLVDSEGVMRKAKDLKVGEALVREDGEFDAIQSIEKIAYDGKVYNVEMNDTETNNNIVVAQGFLNGSVHYQNAGAKEINRVALRAGNVIPTSLVE